MLYLDFVNLDHYPNYLKDFEEKSFLGLWICQCICEVSDVPFFSRFIDKLLIFFYLNYA